MCGICGFVGDRTGLGESDLLRMNATIARRGPDGAGHLVEPGIGLAMRRLSILDLEGGQQPIENEDGSVVVVYNGEIYNFMALREELLAKGHRFRTRSDTEVLVHLYEEHGKELVQRLRGMFALAIWDRRQRSLLLARDRLGIKPLYVAEVGDGLVFGSEIKAVLASGVVSEELDLQAIDEFLAFTFIPAPRSIYRSIRKLRPGHRLIVRDGRISEESWWDVDFSRPDRQATAEEWRARMGEKIADAVASHLVSDVPLGAFLSGGIDSSLVVAMMSQATHEPVQTFTMGFSGAGHALRDERPYAKLLAERYPLEYNEFTVEPDFRAILGEIVDAFDEPFADDSVIPSYYISQLTRRKVKVALSGLGGDELFGGYHRYRGLLLSGRYDLVPAPVRSGMVDPLLQRLPESRSGGDRIDHIKRFSRFATMQPAERYLGYMSSLDAAGRAALYGPKLRGMIDAATTAAVMTEPFRRCESDDLLDRAFYTDLKVYLPDDILALSDRLSMWHSLELRVPLIDHELTELAARMPSRFKVRPRKTKWLLSRLAEDWLPHEIVHHRKQGFEAPMGAWLRGELREFSAGLLSDPKIAATGLFEMPAIRALQEQHARGERKNNKILFSLMMLFAWMQRRLL